jgi:hypothetical protein
MELILNGFEACNIHYSGHWKGWHLKIFFGPKWHLLDCVQQYIQWEKNKELIVPRVLLYTALRRDVACRT